MKYWSEKKKKNYYHWEEYRKDFFRSFAKWREINGFPNKDDPATGELWDIDKNPIPKTKTK